MIGGPTGCTVNSGTEGVDNGIGVGVGVGVCANAGLAIIKLLDTAKIRIRTNEKLLLIHSLLILKNSFIAGIPSS